MISGQTRAAFVARKNRCPLFRIMLLQVSSHHCFALTGFREDVGLMLRGAPALTAGSGSDDLKYTRQPGVS